MVTMDRRSCMRKMSGIWSKTTGENQAGCGAYANTGHGWLIDGAMQRQRGNFEAD
ncbi:MAG: hypothetical protein WA191_14345 [Telluria sp.]|nr:hypothetical protein [Telluria sp.]